MAMGRYTSQVHWYNKSFIECQTDHMNGLWNHLSLTIDSNSNDAYSTSEPSLPLLLLQLVMQMSVQVELIWIKFLRPRVMYIVI